MLRDLQPYVCTHIDCSRPDTLYDSQHDWYEHEVRVHRREWYCGTCPEAFSHKTHMEEHLKKTHPQIGGTPDIEVVLSRCERANSSGEACPLCGDHLKYHQQEKHLGRHMQEAALFTLSNDPDEKEFETEAVHGSARGQQSSQGYSQQPRSDSQDSIDYMVRGPASTSATPPRPPRQQRYYDLEEQEAKLPEDRSSDRGFQKPGSAVVWRQTRSAENSHDHPLSNINDESAWQTLQQRETVTTSTTIVLQQGGQLYELDNSPRTPY